MGKLQNLCGLKFNRLLVIEFCVNEGKWLCQCDCGNKTKVKAYKLKVGSTKSCGCYKKYLAKEKLNNFDNIVGEIFGRLKVLNYEGTIKNTCNRNLRMWNCECECGNKLIIREKSLKSGHTKSCGCLFVEIVKNPFFECLVGKIFGRLIVLNYVGSKWHTRIWQCKCTCGNVIEASQCNLKSGITKSCGCFKKERITKHGKSRDKDYMTYMRNLNPILRLRSQVGNSIRKFLRKGKGIKNGSIFNYLPYTLEQLKTHLESLWEPWMNWDNYGGRSNDKRRTWNIDHIIPHYLFSYKSMSDLLFLECWDLSNLRPLDKIENFKKGRKIIF